MYKAKESYSMWGGDELRSRRSDMNMTQVALARALGISHRMYCYWFGEGCGGSGRYPNVF